MGTTVLVNYLSVLNYITVGKHVSTKIHFALRTSHDGCNINLVSNGTLYFQMNVSARPAMNSST